MDLAIRQYRDYMAAAVLLIMFIKGIVHLAVLMMAYAQG